MEVTDSVFGSIVPQHLLHFKGDEELLSYFRKMLDKNYQKGIVKTEAGHCLNCFAPLSVHDRPRTLPSKSMTKKMCKLLRKDANILTRNNDRALVKKYCDSSTTMVVKCPGCHHPNKTPILSNEAKMALKYKICQKDVQSTDPVEDTSSRKRRKKKRRKQQAHQDMNNSGLIIPTKQKDQDTSMTGQNVDSTEASTSLFPSSFTVKSLLSHSSQTQPQSATVKMTDKTLLKPFTAKKSLHSAPNSDMKIHQFSKTSKRQDLVMKKSTQKNQNKKKQEQLKEFLMNDTREKKSVSLSDFLSSL